MRKNTFDLGKCSIHTSIRETYEKIFHIFGNEDKYVLSDDDRKLYSFFDGVFRWFCGTDGR